MWWYNRDTDDFEDLTQADEGQRYVEGVKRFEFDRHLGPYQIGMYRQWLDLTNCISQSLIRPMFQSDKAGRDCAKLDVAVINSAPLGGRVPTMPHRHLTHFVLAKLC